MREIVARVERQVVGRRQEIELVAAAIGARRHLLLEGPPGTGKSTLLRAIANEIGVGFEFVEGNAELTPARLVGHFDPARVLSDGYAADVYIDGPLVAALRNGSLLYIEELNRVPDETLNALITVMSEGAITVPRLGRIDAADGFRVVSAMNPFDAVGTARISGAIYDRVCRLSVDYQSAIDEVEIVRAETTRADSTVPVEWIEGVVDVARATRAHPELRVGSSVRGAIDTTAVAASLAEMRGIDITDWSLGLDAAQLALSGRVQLRDNGGRRAEEIIAEIWRTIFKPPTVDERDGGNDDDAGKVSAPMGAKTDQQRRPVPQPMK